MVRWTLSAASDTVVADLCFDDEEPLRAIVEAAGSKPPERLVTASDTGNLIVMRERPKRPRRGRPKMEPLDWTPPQADS